MLLASGDKIHLENILISVTILSEHLWPACIRNLVLLHTFRWALKRIKMLCRLALVLFVAVLNISAFDAVPISYENEHANYDLQPVVNQMEREAVNHLPPDYISNGRSAHLQKFKEMNILRSTDKSMAEITVSLKIIIILLGSMIRFSRNLFLLTRNLFFINF